MRAARARRLAFVSDDAALPVFPAAFFDDFDLPDLAVEEDLAGLSAED